MSEHVSDPISAAIEHHRMADAAFDASIARDADEAIKASHEKREGAALRILLRTEPQTIAGCLAVLRYVVDWADNKDAGLFQDRSEATAVAGKAFIPLIADKIEALTHR